MEQRPDEAVPGVCQYDDQGPRHPTATGRRVPYQSQATEVHLRHFPRRGLRHPDSPGVLFTPAPPLQEPPQRCVGDLAPACGQQLLDTGDLETFGSEPLVDLVGPGCQSILGRYLHRPRTGYVHPHQAGELLFRRRGTVLPQTGLHGGRDVLADCRPGHADGRRYMPLATARLPSPYDFCDFHLWTPPCKPLLLLRLD